MHRIRTALGRLFALCLLACAFFLCSLPVQGALTSKPNIVICIADDWSFPHAGILGDAVVRTPNIDRIAREGALFTHAYCASPSCTPSRAAILTGRAPHQLEEGANLWGFLPKKFSTFPDRLETNGYTIGLVGKGWGPGSVPAAQRTRNPAGPNFKTPHDFFAKGPKGKPYCLWFGSNDPHRPYEKGAGTKGGLDSKKVVVPKYWYDSEEVRQDILDYYWEVERFDKQVGDIINTVTERGQLDNTIFIITSDNGMPFPRAKANLYSAGSRIPLVIRFPAKIPGGTKVDAFVNLYDLAPTILEAAGLSVEEGAPSRSLWKLMAGDVAGRDEVFIERERHANVRKGDLSYPARAVRTKDFLYIWNLRPERWPAGDPEMWKAVGEFGDCDNSPTKSVVVGRKDLVGEWFYLRSFGKRPEVELYDLRHDPDELHNVADDWKYRETVATLRKKLVVWMRQTKDPRLDGGGEAFETYPYFGGGERMPLAPKQ